MHGDGLGLANHDRGEAPCRNHGRQLTAQLGRDHVDDAVHLARKAIQRTGLQCFDGILADRGPRCDELHLAQLRSALGQRVQRDLDTGSEGATEKLPLGRHHVEVGRGAEVDDDARAAIERERRQGVRDAIGTNFLRIVREHGYAGPRPRLDDHVGDVRVVAVEHRPHLTQHRRHGRAQRDTGDSRVIPQ